MGNDILPPPTQPQTQEPPPSAYAIPESDYGELELPSSSQAVYDVEGHANTQDPRVNPAAQAMGLPPAAQLASRKRAPDSDDDEDDVDMISKMLPGAAAMKRRRIQQDEEEAARRAAHPEDTPMAEPAPLPKPESSTQHKFQATKGGKKVSQPANPIIAAARALVKEEEDAHHRENMREQAEVPDEEAIKGMKNLAFVEVFEIVPRENLPARIVHGEGSDRWNPKWNGRANFKKFRRRGREGDAGVGRGATGGMRSMAGRVVIQLVEHKGKGAVFGGFGDSQLPAGTQTQKAHEPARARRGASGFGIGSDDDDEPLSVALSRASTRPPHSEESQTLDGSGRSSVTVAGPSGVSSGARGAGRAKRALPVDSSPQESPNKRTRGFMLVGSPSSSRVNRAGSVASGMGERGRGRAVRVEESESSDDDGTRFQFGRR